MIALIQRVSRAAVTIEDREVASIGRGILALIAFQRSDADPQINRMIERLLGYRIFADQSGRMNRSLTDIDGALLVVPQFTLAADTRKGTRPGFSSAMPPDDGRRLFERLRNELIRRWPRSGFGEFGAHMQVALVNDGPVTFWLEAH
ncbi:MAG: D-aminoacyl-tRNA deacylase [Wenzhouxiangellaceae bacterium]